MARAPSRLDRRIYRWVQRLPPSPADDALRRLSKAANHGRLWFAVAAVLGAGKGRGRRAAVRAVGSLAVSSALTNVFAKQLFRRMRPDMSDHPVLRRLRRDPITSSFPSGHSASAGAFATAVCMEYPLAGAAVAPLAAAVAYSRVHVGVHYPGDVVAGATIGAGIALATRHWWPVHPAVPARVRLTGVAPALPDGAGLVVAVNPRSGPDDVNPADEVRELLPRAEVIELGENDHMADLMHAAAERAKAFGVVGGDGSVATAAKVALDHELPLAVVPAGTLNHFAREVGIDTVEAAVEAINAGAGVAVDVATVGRGAVSQHREHRRLPGDGRAPGGAGATVRQVAGAVPRRCLGVADAAAAAPGTQRQADETVDPLHRQLRLHTAWAVTSLAPTAGGRPARRAVPACGQDVQPRPPRPHRFGCGNRQKPDVPAAGGHRADCPLARRTRTDRQGR